MSVVFYYNNVPSKKVTYDNMFSDNLKALNS